MADDGAGGKPKRDWKQWPKIRFVADKEEVKQRVLDGMPVKRKSKRAPLARPKFEVHARIENVLGKVLDGKDLPSVTIGPSLPPRFVLLSQIGSGAQSSVYAVFDRELNCKAALKIFKGGGEARGFKEGRTLMRVEHPNIVRVLDVQLNDDARVFLRMEFIEGPTLRRWVEGRPWREIVAAYAQAGRGLAAAHKEGVVHRDFKPENALVRESDDRVVVVDFGLARARVDAPDIPGADASTASMSFSMHDTRSGLFGTPGYMAPEQFAGKQDSVDARSDQFNFCVALYEALDGARPFEGKDQRAVRDAVMRGRIKGPPKNAPPWVWRVIRRGLAVDPEQRYPSMNMLLAALDNDPRKWLVRAGAFAGVLGIAGAVWLFFEYKDHTHAVEMAQQKAQTDIETRRKEAAEQQLMGRSDLVTLREAMNVMDEDPTKAMAVLAKLSPDSKLWNAPPVRMLVADADYRVVAREVTVLGSDEEPYGLAPDGTLAISRNPTSGEVSLHRLSDGTTRPMGVANTGLPVVEFSADSRFIATQRVPEGVHLWNAMTNAKPQFVGESPDEHHRMLFVGNATIGTFGHDSDVIVLHTGQRQVLRDHVPPVEDVAVDASGRFAATFDNARELRLWTIAGGKARVIPDAIEPFAFGPDGSLAVTTTAACSDLADGIVTALRIVDPTTGASERLCTDTAAPIASIAFSPNGERIAAALPGEVLVWELATGERIDLERPDEEAGELRFATDDVLGSRSPDTTLVLWALPSERPYVLRGHVGVAHWGRREDGTIVTFGQEGRIRSWTLPERRDRPLSSHEDAVTHVAYAGEHMITASRDGTVRAWPPDGGEDRVLSEGRDEIGALAVAPDGRRVAIARSKGDVVVTDVRGATASMLSREQIVGLAWAPDGKHIAIADKDGGFDIVEVASGRVSLRVREPDGFKARGVRFRGDGSVATAGWTDDNAISIRLFDANGNRLGVYELDANAADLSGALAVAFDDQDRSIAISTFQRTVVVWDAESGRMRVLGTHDRKVPGAAFSPDGSQLVTVDEDGVAKLWDVASEFSRTIVFRQPLRAAAFAPDGATFAAVGDARVAFFGRDDLPHDPTALRDRVGAATDLQVETAEPPWVAQ